MRIKFDRSMRGQLMATLKSDDHRELAYATLGLKGLQAEVEFPSDWHEEKRGWVRLSIGVASLNFSFPWGKLAPDRGQCEGPRYGFQFHSEYLWLRYGQDSGYSADRGKTSRTINMPWGWDHVQTVDLTEVETHPYTYRLRSGQLQHVQAIVQVQRSTHKRWWGLSRRGSTYLSVEFSHEVGERSGSWKGGTVGCSYTVRPGESALDTLRRMERERKF